MTAYYHINRIVPWGSYDLLNAGDTIHVGDESNPYFKYFEEQRKAYKVTTDSNSGQEEDFLAIEYLEKVKEGLINPNNLPSIAHGIASHFVMFARELIWEQIRKEEFPKLPSRQRCIWLIPDLDGVRYWIGRLNMSNPFQVVEVNAEGSIHIGDERLLLGDSEPLNETFQKCRKYWNGDIINNQHTEIIFEGKLTITKVINEKDYA